LTANRSYERFEQSRRAVSGADGSDLHHGRNAALAVAVMAALLAVATFLSNEAVKEVVTGETHRADTSAQLESNRVKIDIAEGDSAMLRTLAAGSPNAARAARQARRRESRVAGDLLPADARLQASVEDREHQAAHANTQHIVYELSEVGLEVGIVLASVSIIAGRRWLLGVGGAAATAGFILLLAGLLV
jgi:Domain of unknown function (DUF4337)